MSRACTYVESKIGNEDSAPPNISQLPEIVGYTMQYVEKVGKSSRYSSKEKETVCIEFLAYSMGRWGVEASDDLLKNMISVASLASKTKFKLNINWKRVGSVLWLIVKGFFQKSYVAV